MTYDLWDVELGKQLGSYSTEAEALRLARLLIDAYGEEYAADLELAVEDERGPNLTGSALVERARTIAPIPEPV